MLKISVQTGGCTDNMGMEAGLAAIRAAGFEALDFNICSYANYEYTASEGQKGESIFAGSDEEVMAFFRDCYQKVRAAGLTVGQTHAPFPSGSPVGEDNRLTDFHMRLLRLSIPITAEMECPYVVIHPGFSGSVDYDNRPDKQAQFWEENRRMYLSLLPDAKKYGVKICLENMWGSLRPVRPGIIPAVISHPGEFAAWIDRLNEEAGGEYFVACLDTGHAFLTGDDAAEMVAVLGHRLKALHMHDVEQDHDRHTCPYVGRTNWQALAAALHRAGYTGTLNFETGGFPQKFPPELCGDAMMLLGKTAQYFRRMVEESR